jgi:mono/diheme cytochrome c family protein
MKPRHSQVARLCLFAGLFAALSTPVFSYEGDLKRGRLYYRQVCTACHQSAGKTIAPNEKTKAEWAAYIKADKHDKTGKSNASLKYFTGKAYRTSIKETNKVAAKLVAVPEQELESDLAAWVAYGAKDSDNPSGCQ